MNALRHHYPEYLMEAAGLGVFMLSASIVTVALEHPASSIHQAIHNPLLRRMIIGLAMGLTAIALIYSPWGKQSGAHLNPAITLTFLRLGKVRRVDALFYVLAQLIGGCVGVFFAANILGAAIAHPAVNYVVTLPGSAGIAIAFGAELAISLGMMMMVLLVSNTPKLARFTGLFAGFLIAIYITLEAPLSGMSMNPARTLASAIPPHNWTAIWVYFTAPLAGMLLASEIYVWSKGRKSVQCAKLYHSHTTCCIFRCGYRNQSR